MSRRARRRRLVAAVYAALAACIGVTWYFTHWRGTGAYVYFAALLACRLFFGGYYRGGLVKPFQYRKPRNADIPPPFFALKLRIYQPVFDDDDEHAFRNDERELHQRDYAHYLAYQAIGVVIAAEAFLVPLRMIVRRLQHWRGMTPEELYYGFALVALTLFMTLPQAILLWTEPDMDEA